MENQLEEYKQQTASELAGLQNKVTSELAGVENMTTDLHNSLQFNTQQLTQLCAKIDILDSKLISTNAQCIPVSLPSTPTLMATFSSLPPSPKTQTPYPIPSLTTLPPSPFFSCGSTGGWRRVVYLNFTDPNTPCPSGWKLTCHSKRTCGRVSNSRLTCDSVIFPVSGGDYTRVCGRIIGYQYRDISGFWAYHNGRVTTIDGSYVSGISLTHGSPRQHIWTFGAGFFEFHPTSNSLCSCDASISITIPPFMGGDCFCESGYNSQPRPQSYFFPDDPLWDGDGCTASSTCCSFNNPPYFTKQLPSPTTDDIEARLCHEDGQEDTPIEFIELYVQ